ncbi:MAG: TatD family hydrolase [Deltaproteobacteria bacterium]|jgi:TatD DNase family protein|nr:TatD family hydrolase [Deltaproteobacteria bacterium]
MEIIDTHCHLFLEDFDADREEVLARAAEAGVVRIVNVGLETESNRLVVETARLNPVLAPAVGWHPHNVRDLTDEGLETLAGLSLDPSVVAFGEIGLDYYHGLEHAGLQRAALRTLLGLAAKRRLPVVVHCRDAWDDFFEILEPARSSLKDVVLHCFSGGPAEVEKACGLDCYFSFSGTVTYPKAVPVREACPLVPEDRILVETDAPYLAPLPRRGRRNEPSFLPSHLEAMAALRGTGAEELAGLTGQNARRLFNLDRA